MDGEQALHDLRQPVGLCSLILYPCAPLFAVAALARLLPVNPQPRRSR